MREEALDWYAEAEVDLQHAASSLNAGFYNWACFSAQQAVEKALKVLIMVAKRRRPTHVHDLIVLYDDAKDVLALPEDLSTKLGELSAYYTIARYPNAGFRRPSRSIGRAQAETALFTAEKVVGLVGERLGIA